jgi:membrane protease subunit (stomatin/prohibitin family)
MPNMPGFMDEIRCDEKDYLIWKWRAGDPKSQRENAIRWGSSLSVRDGSVAVFVYRRKGEPAVQEFIEGPFQDTLKTSNLPVIASIVSAAYAGGTPWQAEVYFINLAKVIQSRFAVRYFDVFDPRFPDFGVPVAVRGTITFRISDYKEFIELHRLDEFSLEDFQEQIKDAVSRKVKAVVAKLPESQGVPLPQLSGMTDAVSDAANELLADKLRETFGVELASLDVSAVDVDKDSVGYHQLKAMTQDVTSATIRAQTEANIRNIQELQHVQMENLSEQLRIEREEGQYALHKQTQSANLPAFQVEQQAAVGVAGAEALGHMGQNGAGSVSTGHGGGLDIAGLAASMAIGGAVGQNIAGAMNNAMGGAGAAGVAGGVAAAGAGVTPPPVPVSSYYVAVNGAATGPFDMAALRSMVSSGALATETLVWKAGMSEWKSASEVSEVAAILGGGAPTPPPVPE